MSIGIARAAPTFRNAAQMPLITVMRRRIAQFFHAGSSGTAETDKI